MSLSNEEQRYWLALSLMPGLGLVRIHKLMALCDGELARVFAKPQLALKIGLDAALIQQIREPNWRQVDAALAWAEAKDCHIIYYNDADYPRLLKEISSPPALFYLQGEREIFRLPQLAIVGSRNPTAAGRDTAYQFADFLSQQGLGICSGLALGIDTAAHQGALRQAGITLAVLGSGLQQIYPARNRKLYEEIIVNGAVISEFPLNTAPKAQHFPRRNRIISGLSLGCLVVEAAVQSGSLITARYAMEQGRDVFAIPGSIHNPLARGCHRLLRDGAKLVETGMDVISELHALLQLQQAPAKPPASEQVASEASVKQLDPSYRKLFDAIDYDATSIDSLVQRTGMPSHEIASMLVILKLEGMISAVAGGYAKV